MKALNRILLLVVVTIVAVRALADGVPEPGLILYGKVRNAAAGNALVTQGTLTFTMQQVGGAAVVVSTPVLALAPGQSFRARVPFEVLLGSAATLSAGTFKMPASTLAFQITQATFTHPSICLVAVPPCGLSPLLFAPRKVRVASLCLATSLLLAVEPGDEPSVLTWKLHTFSVARCRLSLTPCFSWVLSGCGELNRFNGFPHPDQTVETVATARTLAHTQLKQGVNERTPSLRLIACEISRLKLLTGKQ